MSNSLLYSSDSDEEPPPRKIRVFVPRKDPLADLDDTQFYQRFRFDKASFNRLLGFLRNDLTHPTNRSCALTAEEQLLITLRFYGSGSFQIMVGDTINVHKSTVCRVVHRVTNVIIDRLANDWIKFPDTDQGLSRLQRNFFDVAGFPGVLGAIDCSHFVIERPHRNPDDFINRKGKHSINAQFIVDSAGTIMHVFANWPGSAHDSFILRDSSIYDSFETGNLRGKGLIVGDQGYPCREWLMIPYSTTAPLQRHQERYNKAHCLTRLAVERAFGRLKRRWHLLHSEIRMQPDRVVRLIVACSILHNIAQAWNQPDFDDDDCQDDFEADGNDGHTVDIDGSCDDGTARREAIARGYFMRRAH